MLLFVLLFCLFLLFFNCDIVALQYSISFCCAAKWISCVYICPLLLGHPFLASHPTPLGHHGAQSRAPCAVLTIYLHRAVCVHHWYSLSYSHPPQSVLIPVISVSYCFTNYFEIWPSHHVLHVVNLVIVLRLLGKKIHALFTAYGVWQIASNLTNFVMYRGLGFTHDHRGIGKCGKVTWKCWPFSHVPLFETPWTVSCQVSLSKKFSRQEYCSG